MATLAHLLVKLGVDTSEWDSKLDSAGGKLSAAGDRMSAFGGKLTLGVTTPLLAAAGAAAKLAIDAEETASKFNTVFEGSVAEVQARLDEMAKTIPLTGTELRAATADLAVLGKAAGLSADEAAALSTRFVTAAADLGSFNNVETPEALAAIRSALVGSSEPLLRFGIDTRQATLEAIALEQGLIKEGEAMDASTRAAAVMAAIQTHASDAMGDAAKTADSTANSLKFLKRDVVDLATDIGEQLVPIIRPLIAQLVEWLGKLREMDPGIRNTILVVLGLAAALGPLLVVFGTIASAIGALLPVLGAVGTVLGGVSLAAAAPVVAIGLLVGALVLLYTKSETVRDIVNAAFEKIRDVAVAAFGAVRDAVSEILGEVLETIDVRFVQPIKIIWEKWGEEIETVARIAWEAISTIIGTQLKIIGEVISTAFGLIKEGILLVLNLIQGDWSGAWDNIKNIVSIAGEGLLGILGALWDGISQLFTPALEGLKTQWGEAWDWIRDAPGRIRDALLGAVTDLIEGIRGFFEAGGARVGEAVDAIFEKISSVFASIKSTVLTIAGAMWDEIKGVFQAAIDTIRGKMEDFVRTVVAPFERIKAIVVGNSIWPEMWDEVRNVLETGTVGIEGRVGEFADTIVGKFAALGTDAIAKVDEMCGGWLGRFGIGLDTISGLFTDWKGTLFGIVDEITGGLIGKFSSLWDSLTGLFSGGFSGFVQGLAGIIPAVMDIASTVTGLVSGISTAVSGAVAAVTGGGAAAGGAGIGFGVGVPGAWSAVGSGGGGAAAAGSGAAAAGGGGLLGTIGAAGIVPGVTFGLLGAVELGKMLFGGNQYTSRYSEMLADQRRQEADLWASRGVMLPGSLGGSYGNPTGGAAHGLGSVYNPLTGPQAPLYGGGSYNDPMRKTEFVAELYLDSEKVAEAVAPVLVNRALG